MVCMAGGLPFEPGDRGHVDDAAGFARDHALLGDDLAQQEVAPHVEVHHLVPGLQRVVLGRGAQAAPALLTRMSTSPMRCRFHRPSAGCRTLRRIGSDPTRVDARGLQARQHASSRSVGLARADQHAWRRPRPEHGPAAGPSRAEPPVISAVLPLRSKSCWMVRVMVSALVSKRGRHCAQCRARRCPGGDMPSHRGLFLAQA